MSHHGDRRARNRRHLVLVASAVSVILSRTEAHQRALPGGPPTYVAHPAHGRRHLWSRPRR